MPKTVSATEAKVRLGAMIEWAVTHRDEVIIESRGKPRAVLMDVGAYESLRQAREIVRRQEALQRLDALASRVGSRNTDLDAGSAESLADRFVRDVTKDLAAGE